MQHLMGLVRRCVDDYQMIEAGDRIAVGVSGGKDSLALLALMAGLKQYYPKPFELAAITIDMGMGMDFGPVEDFCRSLGVPYTCVKTEIGPIIFDVRKEKNPCSMCAKMRRGALNDALKAQGFNKIALGHHYDDVIETTLMAMLYGGQIQAMPPMLKAKNFPGMTLIRPLYRVREADIIAWRDAFELEFLRCACRLSESAAVDESASKRQEIKRLIAALHQTNPKVEQNIFNSIHRVQLDTLVGWKYRGEAHGFLETIDKF